jgi:hypothetical protein
MKYWADVLDAVEAGRKITINVDDMPPWFDQ